MADSGTDVRPLIGVTGPVGRFSIAWRFSRYALHRAGARAVHLTAKAPNPPVPLDGIVIGGGSDIDPALYLPDFFDDQLLVDVQRDALEVDMIKRSLESGLPILGICRGAQLMNVVLGGSLHRDLRALRRRTSHRRTPFARKTLHVQQHTLLHRLMGTGVARINSLHNQAIDRVGEGLMVSGRDLDGIVQAVERQDGPMVLGVQWHPEYLPLRPEQGALFRALVAAARDRASTVPGESV